MAWGELTLNTLALLVYPGAALAAALGLGAEAAASRLLGDGRNLLVEFRPRPGVSLGLPPLATGAALLLLLAACQLAAPFNPVAPAQRNLLVAIVALASAVWLVWAWGWNRGHLEPRLVLVAQACWLVALLAPALVAQTLRPQVLGAVVLPAQLALKVVSGALFLLCLPALLQLLPETAPQGVPGTGGERPGLEQAGFAAVRVLLWLPLCGLFASVFFPPGGDDGGGLVRFLAPTLGAAAVGLALAVLISRRSGAMRLVYLRLAPLLALLAIVLAAAVALYA